jgi:hypothetical protein
MSLAVKRILRGADQIREHLNHKRIDPLHLLAATVADEANETGRILRASGVSEEAVVNALR